MLTYSSLYPQDTETRQFISLDGMWKFKIDWESQGRQSGWQEGLYGYDMIPVPASFQDFYTEKEIREFVGDVWYETEVFVSDRWQGEALFLRFGAATHKADIYVNGQYAGSHEGGFLPFSVDISKTVLFNQKNRITAVVNNELSVTNIPCGATITLKNGRKKAAPYFDFYNYSGLHRSVQIIVCPEEYVFDYSTVYELDGTDANVRYSVVTTGNNLVELELFDEEGNLAAKASGKEGVLNVKNARLWQVRDAYLYTLRIQIRDGARLIDQYEDQIGIRTVAIRDTKILINGTPVYLKGFGKHEDSDVSGRGFNRCMMKRDFELMKWIGANSFRTSHYPYDEEIYRMADREGFLIIDEVAAVGLFKSTKNFVDASNGKMSAFFEADTIPRLLTRHLEDIEELIARDKNHASVIAWSLLNEPETTSEESVPYFKALFEKARELDPQRRPRTFAEIKNSGPYICKCHQFSDFICLNRYYGWYIKGGYEISDAFEDFREEMRQWKEVEPNKPFVFTEYGADTSALEHKLPSVMWSQEYQEEILELTNEVFDSLDFVVGEQVWNFADFQTTEGIMRVNGNKKGIFTRQRQPKAAAFLLKKRWESLPLDYKKDR
ncbi:beta-glucuronidase [Clostridium sp. Marseille-P2415]|uniref:beta-glucuronidase n=1 Tax=Clostridium sp. Marseille-P2415 TaxID=1805471 RepID=UPI0009886DE8|nr:beta-glucuronidase [Clostridium sp. Marseille-P2415]